MKKTALIRPHSNKKDAGNRKASSCPRPIQLAPSAVHYFRLLT